MQSRTGFPLLAGMFLFLAGSTGVAGSEVRHLGGQLQLFLDDWLVESGDNVLRVLHRPERREAAIRVDRPWEDIYMYNPVVIKDGHRYRMWYRAKYLARPFLTAYAESLDGIHWVKPNLGLIEFDGSRNNNIIWPIAGADGRSFSVFKDENPDARADARYKAITNLNEITESGKRRAVIYGLASPDGLRWRHLHKEPMVKALVEDPQFDSHNIALWDPVRRHYAIYARGWYRKGLPPPGSERVGRTADTVTMKLPSGETREMTHIRDIRRYVLQGLRELVATGVHRIGWSADGAPLQKTPRLPTTGTPASCSCSRSGSFPREKPIRTGNTSVFPTSSSCSAATA